MFRRSRWLLVVLAILVIGAVELVSDSLLDPIVPFSGDTLLVMAVIAGVGLAGVTLAFRSIDRLAAELRERNAELEASNATTRALHRVSLALATLSDLDVDPRYGRRQRARPARRRCRVAGPGSIGRDHHARGCQRPRRAFDREGPFAGTDFRRFVDDDLILTP